MDALRRDDLERARRTPPAVRASQALELMRAGIRLKRVQLRARFPQESEQELDSRVGRWLTRRD